MTQKYFSIRAFAKEVKVSDTAIHKARASGRLSEKCFRTNPKNKRPEIIFEVALKEWKEITGTVVDLEVIEPFKKKSEPAGKIKNQSDFIIEDDDDEDDDEFIKPKRARNNSTLAQANVLKAIHDANLKRAELLELQGMLIKKEKVYNALFEFGQELRITFQSIPDKTVDHILAAASRTEAHKILSEAINTALSKLSSVENKTIKFGNR